MPEISPPQLEPFAVGEKPPALSPEAYRDWSIQRKIIEYGVTGDTISFKRSDGEVTQSQAVEFSKDLVSGKFDAEKLSEMLRYLPHGLSGKESRHSYNNLGTMLEYNQVMRQEMVFLAGVGDQDLTLADISRFLEKYPTPVELGSKMDDYLDSIEKAQGGEARIRYENTARVLIDSLYGQRQMYYQNFRLMLDKVEEGATKKRPLELKKPSRAKRVKGALPAVTLALASMYGATSIASDLMKDGRVDGPFVGEEITSGRHETELENSVENKFNIEILDIREAFKKRGWDFDVYNQSELGNHPPTRWTEDQISLLSELLPRLPAKFYSPRGEVLDFSLTDYGDNCPCAGTFQENFPNMRSAMVLLSDSNFNRDKGDWPFRLLTHELAHRVDIDLLEESLWPKVNNILGYDNFSDARDNFFPKLDEVSRSIPGLETLKERLNYGFMGIKDEGLTDPTELIAVLAETYVGGPDEFRQVGEFLGEDVANKLYDLLKKEMFDGVEYESSESNGLAQEIFDKYQVIISDQENGAVWDMHELKMLEVFIKSLPSEMTSLRKTTDGSGEHDVNLVVAFGSEVDFIQPADFDLGRDHETLVLPKDLFKSGPEAFSVFASRLIQRSDSYDPAVKYLLNNLNLENEKQAEAVLKSLATLYLKGIDQYSYSSSSLIDNYLSGVSRKERKKIEKRIGSFLVDGIFEGRSYVVNDGAITVFQDNQITTTSLDN